MSILNVHSLSRTFGERLLFSEVSFDIEAHDKVGFIGANGVGKTTIFKIINGRLAPTSGDIFVAKGCNVGYMEQHACNTPGRTVYDELLSVFEELIGMEKEIDMLNISMSQNRSDLEELISKHSILLEKFERDGGLTYKSRTSSTLRGLGFSEQDFTMPTAKLSGGQRSKLSLAKLLLSKSDILLLDEPTNHLDIDSVNWLEGFIKEFNGAVIIISHDRYFLDSVTNKTLELEHQKIRMYTGNYSQFTEKKKQVDEALENKYENDLKEIKRIEGIIEQQKRFNQAHNYVTAASKQKQLDKIKENLVAPEQQLEALNFKLRTNRVSGNDVLICNGISKSFGNKSLFSNVNMHIGRGERVFIIGANGCGKTTFFRILTGELQPDSGEITFGAKVDVGYFDQMQNNLNLDKTAIDQIWDEYPTLTQTQVRTALGRFLFKGDEVAKPLNKMSGGERARISILNLMLGGDNFLLLDEPTNHLDTASREALENTLRDYDGTMLLISHDRYFINKLATRILVLSENGVTEYLGNYDYYKEKVKEQAQRVEVKSEKPKQNEYKLRKEQQAAQRKRENRIKKLEEEIAAKEELIEEINKKLQSDEVATDYEKITEFTNILQTEQTALDSMYEEWEELC